MKNETIDTARNVLIITASHPLSTPNSTLTQYKAYNSGTSGVTMSDINIEWCHRWPWYQSIVL